MAVTVCSPCIDVLIIRRWAERWNQTTGIRAELCTATRNKECCVCACVFMCACRPTRPRICANQYTRYHSPERVPSPPATTLPRRPLLAIKQRKQSPPPDIWAGLTTGAYLVERGEEKKTRGMKIERFHRFPLFGLRM